MELKKTVDEDEEYGDEEEEDEEDEEEEEDDVDFEYGKRLEREAEEYRASPEGRAEWQEWSEKSNQAIRNMIGEGPSSASEKV